VYGHLPSYPITAFRLSSRQIGCVDGAAPTTRPAQTRKVHGKNAQAEQIVQRALSPAGDASQKMGRVPEARTRSGASVAQIADG